MKICNKYSNYFFSGEWHIHTNFTDGENSILEYVETAHKLKIPLLAFTEHVRKNLTYNYEDFLKEITFAKKKFPHIILLSGIEAKVLENGELDCPEHVFEKADYKLFAFHSFPDDLELYFSSIKKIIANYKVDAWAHPGLFFEKNAKLMLSNDQLTQIFHLINKNQILLEINFRYYLPRLNWIKEYFKISNNGNFIFGLDAHSIDDLYKTWNIKQKFKTHYKKAFFNKISITEYFYWFVKNYPEKFTKEKID